MKPGECVVRDDVANTALAMRALRAL